MIIQKDQAAPNYVGWIRSNLNFDSILKIQMAKKAKSFLAIFGTDTGHKGLKLHSTLSH